MGRRDGTDRAISGFAMVDPGVFGLNLFRSLPRRNRPVARLHAFEVNTVYDGRKLRVAGPYTLGADDLSVLLAVLALAGMLGLEVQAASSEVNRVAIVDGLESEGELVAATHVQLRTTQYTLCREVGIIPNGQAYERVTESLWRMQAMSIGDYGPVGANAKRMRAGGSQRLLSARTEEDGDFTIVVNARFARYLLGPQYIRVDLRESRQLGEMARLLHLRLCCVVNLGCRLSVTLDKAAEWLYGGPPASDAQRRERRKEVRAAVADLGALSGWSLIEDRSRLMVAVARHGAERGNEGAPGKRVGEGSAPAPPMHA